MSEIEVTEGSGNVFADLEVADAEEELLKAQLTHQIHTIIKQRGLTQTKAAELLGVHQPQVSMLMRSRSGSFSVARLMRFLARLDQDVQITVQPKAPDHAGGRVQVLVARAEPTHA
jgi:predicted XRE-type DNA-binding protein